MFHCNPFLSLKKIVSFVIGIHEPLDVDEGDSTLSPLEEQQLLTTENSLQPLNTVSSSILMLDVQGPLGLILYVSKLGEGYR